MGNISRVARYKGKKGQNLHVQQGQRVNYLNLVR